MSRTLRYCVLSVALTSAVWGQPAGSCSCGGNSPGIPAPRAMEPYAGEPEDMRPFSRFTQPYYEHYTKIVE